MFRNGGRTSLWTEERQKNDDDVEIRGRQRMSRYRIHRYDTWLRESPSRLRFHARIRHGGSMPGVVGSGVVLHLLAETKTTVIAVVREGSAPSNLGENHPRLIVVPGIAADGSMDTLQQAIRDAIGDRQIDHVVSIFGGKAPRKPLSAFDDADVMASAERSLPHLRLLKSVPMPTTSYTFVSGMCVLIT